MNNFLHSVFFWLRPDLEQTRRDEFVRALHAIGESPNVEHLRVGVPAGTSRDVVDNSWDYQIVVGFANRADHEAYQSTADAAHQAFIAGFADCWTRVQVYDSLPVE